MFGMLFLSLKIKIVAESVAKWNFRHGNDGITKSDVHDKYDYRRWKRSTGIYLVDLITCKKNIIASNWPGNSILPENWPNVVLCVIMVVIFLSMNVAFNIDHAAA